MGIFDSRPNLNSNKFDQQGCDTLYLAGHNCICGTGGTISSNNGYQSSGVTVLKTGVQTNTILVGCGADGNAAATAVGAAAKAMGIGSVAIGCAACTSCTGSIAIGTESVASCNCSVSIGHTNIVFAENSSIIGGCGNTICSGNTNTTLIGGSGILLDSNCYANYTVVPNLAIYNSPSGSGSILCYDSITKKVGLTTDATVGFLGLATKTTAEPTGVKQNQWVRPKPEPDGNYSYTFTNFCDSLGLPIAVNLSLEEVYLKYCQTGDYWTKEYFDRPLASGKTWIGNAASAVCEIPVIDEWVYADTALSYIGQKFAYPTQTVLKSDLDTCITVPNYIFIQNINLKNVGNTAIFTIPTGKVAVVNSLKLITLQNVSPTTFTVSVGNNSSNYNNISACYAIDDVLQYETYCLPMDTSPGKAIPATLGSTLYFRVATGSTSGSNLCAHLLVEAFLF